MDSYIYACICFVIVSIVQSIIVNILVTNHKRELLRDLEEAFVQGNKRPADINEVHLRNRERLQQFQFRRQQPRVDERDIFSAGSCFSMLGKLWRRVESTHPKDFDKASGRIIPFAFMMYNIYYWAETAKLQK